MTIYLQNGNIHYKQSAPLLNFFEEIVKTPFEQHQKTDAWQREVVDSYKNRDFEHIRSIVGADKQRLMNPLTNSLQTTEC